MRRVYFSRLYAWESQCEGDETLNRITISNSFLSPELEEYVLFCRKRTKTKFYKKGELFFPRYKVHFAVTYGMGITGILEKTIILDRN